MIKAFGQTDIGCVRKENEDDFCVFSNAHEDWIAAVCDGIGGSAGGEVASKIAVRTLKEAFEKAPEFMKDSQVNDWIQSTLNKANDAIYYKGLHSDDEKGMGTTCVGAIITGDSTYIFNVGDSRIYADYTEGLVQMSEDHSVVARLLRSGQITPEEAKTHVQRNTLTNALGIWRVFQIDIHKIDPGYQYLLISSDGLHGYVAHDDIQAIVENQDLDVKTKTEALIARANNAGGYDNCTVIVLENVKE
ncbi:Stp1/IreP family PP2C-type Ser/Thr phosphatase [Catenisphaera adipataccumulans]|jgi:serine/threonine protein phosphatase PrpC|uniref:Protein phosphatase n=1 Tax=Catenisphaera adipataccumulans TaxID=700500 RepID=A0A7W8CY18_9FIRM|nr:Stp1/IreP family PP2C-type Ser/Thr phosphatase [Catenisphaera adipataccumulans]MBB5183681.1 protein phosphatase [Catenisphaera adipataccumulans]